jgi:hypothetical protein
MFAIQEIVNNDWPPSLLGFKRTTYGYYVRVLTSLPLDGSDILFYLNKLEQCREIDQTDRYISLLQLNDYFNYTAITPDQLKSSPYSVDFITRRLQKLDLGDYYSRDVVTPDGIILLAVELLLHKYLNEEKDSLHLNKFFGYRYDYSPHRLPLPVFYFDITRDGRMKNAFLYFINEAALLLGGLPLTQTKEDFYSEMYKYFLGMTLLDKKTARKITTDVIRILYDHFDDDTNITV